MLLLLDIDGVMVPARSWKSPEFLNDGFPAFSSKAIRVIQDLINDNFTVILTTSHKSNFSINEWKNIFRVRGIDIQNLNLLPNNIHNRSRKDEIVSWFSTRIVAENFVIIDDDKSLNELPIFLKEHLVQTAAHIGLTEDHLPLIFSIFNKIS